LNTTRHARESSGKGAGGDASASRLATGLSGVDGNAAAAFGFGAASASISSSRRAHASSGASNCKI
jgi:hypothetical protein